MSQKQKLIEEAKKMTTEEVLERIKVDETFRKLILE